MSTSDINIRTPNFALDQDFTKVSLPPTLPAYLITQAPWYGFLSLFNTNPLSFDSLNQETVQTPYAPRVSYPSLPVGYIEPTTLDNLRHQVHPDGYPTSELPIGPFHNANVSDTIFATEESVRNHQLNVEELDERLEIVKRNEKALKGKHYHYHPYKAIKVFQMEQKMKEAKGKRIQKTRKPNIKSKKQSQELMDIGDIK